MTNPLTTNLNDLSFRSLFGLETEPPIQKINYSLPSIEVTGDDEKDPVDIELWIDDDEDDDSDDDEDDEDDENEDDDDFLDDFDDDDDSDEDGGDDDEDN